MNIEDETTPTPDEVPVEAEFSDARVIGHAVYIRLENIRYDTPGMHTGGRSLTGERFLGRDVVWVNSEHITSISPGKAIEINGRMVPTVNISIMEENFYRIDGTCEELLDRMAATYTEFYMHMEHEMHKSSEGPRGVHDGTFDLTRVNELQI